MKLKLPFIVFSITLVLLAAGYWLIGGIGVTAIIRAKGDQSPPVHLDAGKGLYILKVETIIDPGYHGDLHINLEGVPGMNYSLFNPSALLHPFSTSQPELNQHDLLGLKPRDRVSLWVLMQPKPPVPTGLTAQDSLPPCCTSAGHLEGSSLTTASDWTKPLRLSFRDSGTNRLLLAIPVQIGTPVGVDFHQTPPTTAELNQLFEKDPRESAN